MTSIQEKICQAGRIMFDKRLTDLCGGNISARDGETIYMSPRFAGQAFHWDLQPEDLVSGQWDTDEITTNPAFHARVGLTCTFIVPFPMSRLSSMPTLSILCHFLPLINPWNRYWKPL